MSPEIINGHQFDLPTDVFSLGIIFIEILSRKLVDSRTYTVSCPTLVQPVAHPQRTAPTFTPDPEEVRRRASPGCPPALVDLALACCLEDPLDRPLMSEVLKTLREIELEVIYRTDESAEHVGSIKLVHNAGKRGMPIFDPPQPGVQEETSVEVKEAEEADHGEEEVRQMEQDALDTLAKLDVGGGGASIMDSEAGTWRTARWDERVFQQLEDSEIKGKLPHANFELIRKDTNDCYLLPILRRLSLQRQTPLRPTLPMLFAPNPFKALQHSETPNQSKTKRPDRQSLSRVTLQSFFPLNPTLAKLWGKTVNSLLDTISKRNERKSRGWRRRMARRRRKRFRLKVRLGRSPVWPVRKSWARCLVRVR